MDIMIGIVVAVLFGAAGLAAGRASGRAAGRAAGLEEARAEAQARLRELVGSVARGRAAVGLKPGSPEAELQQALERGWAPRDTERQEALREAIGRVGSFLDTQVRAPLSGFSAHADADELRERIDRALGALQDLDFFVTETQEVRQGTDVSALAKKVSREFAADHEVGVRLRLGGPAIRATVNPAALMDALYLVLHNAARFGDGSTIDLNVENDAGHAKIVVRDRGQGFSEEAFKRAFDPFYSTSSEGLGLGLSHARKVVEAMGGEIELRNVPDGGAEVEMSFPLA